MIFGKESSKKKLFRLGGLGGGVFIFSLLILVTRLFILARIDCFQAETSWQAGHPEEALESFSWSIRNHFPGNPYSQRAVEKTLRIADEYHQKGQTHLYRHALLNLRAALYAIRSWYQPFQSQLEQIEQQLQAITDLE